MATHDYVIANGTGAAVRSDLNGALAAIVSNNSSATEPATMYAYQWWPDTTTGLLKQRNSANSAWITIGTLASTNLGLLSLAGGTMTGVLAVTAGTAALPGIAVSGDLNTGITSPGADQLAISTGGTVRATVDSSGRLLVGTSSSRTTTNTPQILVESVNTTTGDRGITVVGGGASNVSPLINFAKHRSASIGGTTVVSDGDYTGAIVFNGSDGTNFIQSALIAAVVDGTPGTNDMPGRLVFSTTADGASSPTERMRVTQAGKICMGNFYSSQPETLQVYALDSANGYCILANVAGVGTRTHIRFENGNGMVGSITSSGSSTAYNTSSDYRLKENVVPLTGAIDRVNDLQVRRFNFIVNPDQTVDGFLAHEAQAVVPECVTGEKDAVDEDGNPRYQGIDQAKLVPLLTAALQEAIAEINALKDRLTAAGIA